MNYRHIFHAGNICDIVKHVVLVLLIDHLRVKDKPFFLLDTHAGIGIYDLQHLSALKTGEAQNGIYRLIATKPQPLLNEYYKILHKLNPAWLPEQPDTFRYYPGSPIIARQMMRAKDRLVLCELHIEDHYELKRQFLEDTQVHVHRRDGYEALRAFLPPDEKRGLVLIDPPYEDANEFEHLVSALTASLKRWPLGQYLIWYPVKDRPAIWRFHEALAATGIQKQLSAEFIFQEEIHGDKLNGSGFILINPPWQFEEKLKQLFPLLHQALHTPHQISQIKWLIGE